ncbi:MAG: LysR family transcriptional regulator [Pseudomonadota bacterium]
MQDLNDLYYFVQVVDHQGFAPAGRALGTPKSKLSRRLANLEERLGVELLKRSTRHFSVTEIGKRYYQHCKAMLVEAEAAQQAIEMTRAEPCGLVRISCPVGLVESTVSPMLAKFMLQYPRVNIQLEATNRRVDLDEEPIDFALRVRRLPLDDSQWVMRRLGDREQLLLASPALLSQYPATERPDDLVQFPSLFLGQEHQNFEWHLLGSGGDQATIKHKPRFVTRDMAALREAALAGVGVVQLPTMMVREELRNKSLVEAIPGWAPPVETIHLVFGSHRGLLPTVRALIDFLAAEFALINQQ